MALTDESVLRAWVLLSQSPAAKTPLLTSLMNKCIDKFYMILNGERQVKYSHRRFVLLSARPAHSCTDTLHASRL